MSSLWSRAVHGLNPYVPGEQPSVANLTKLNTNENPYGPSPKALDAIRDAAAETLRLYPDPESKELRGALAAYHGVRHEQVFVGNGSDEVLAHAFVALLKQEAPLLLPDVTYSFYPAYCRLFDVPAKTVPLDASLRVRTSGYDVAGGAILLANPNAPTGLALNREELAALLETHRDKPVLVDEAYVDFGGESAIPLVASFPNLLVVQTMSKSRALAGLRVGYAIGDASLIEALNRVKNSFNSYPLGRAAQAGAVASLKDETYFQTRRAMVIAERRRMVQALAELGFEALPSNANFIFVRHRDRSGQALHRSLRDRGVLVRHFDKPRIADYLRISVGRTDDTDRLVAAVEASLASPE